MFIVQISPEVQRTLNYLPPGIGTHSFTVSSSWEEYSAFSAAEAIHTVAIFVPPGTHYCWVDRGGVDSKFALPQTPRSRVQRLNHSATLSTRGHVN